MASWEEGRRGCGYGDHHRRGLTKEANWPSSPRAETEKRERGRQSLGRERDEVGNHENASWGTGYPRELRASLGNHNADHSRPVSIIIRAGLDLDSGLKNGLGCKKSIPLIGREVGTRLFKFTP